MIKKIIIWGLVVFAAYFLYKKFMAPTVEPYLSEEKPGVDFLGTSTVTTVDTLLKTKGSGN